MSKVYRMEIQYSTGLTQRGTDKRYYRLAYCESEEAIYDYRVYADGDEIFLRNGVFFEAAKFSPFLEKVFSELKKSIAESPYPARLI